MPVFTSTEMEKTGAAILSDHRDEMIDFMIADGASPMLAEMSINQLWERWSRGLAEERKVTQNYAEYCLTAALVFLEHRRDSSGDAPGRIADIGWHYMLHHDTRAYAAVSDALAGRYVHHLPNDIAGFNDSIKGKCNDTNDGGGSSGCVCS